MSKTLILYFHPEPAKSRANRAMIAGVDALDDVTVVDMTALYPDPRAFDVGAEVERLYTADRLVLQFPIHWYLPPPLLSAWQNVVLTQMFYIHPDDEGARLKGLPVMLAVTAGNVPEAYGPDGVNLFPLEDLLRPLHSTASRCGWHWFDPFVTYRANRLDDAERVALGERYAACLGAWRAAIPRDGTGR